MPKIKSYKTADELLNMIANTKKVSLFTYKSKNEYNLFSGGRCYSLPRL